MIAAAALALTALSSSASLDVVDHLPAIAPHRIWNSPRGSIWVTPCQHTDAGPGECVGLQVRRGGERRLLGQGYLPVAADVLWRGGAGVAGPDVVVFGDFGGSNGCEQLFAVSFTASAVRSRKLEPCHSPPLPVTVRRGRAMTELMFPAGGPAVGGANATTAGVQVPVVWRDGRFQVDLAEITARSRGPDDLAVREAAVRASLDEAVEREKGEVVGDALRPAVQALFGLMLYGRADEARTLLHASWPVTLVSTTPFTTRPVPGEELFWRKLCGAAVRNPLWAEIGMDRIPNSDLIRAGATATLP